MEPTSFSTYFPVALVLTGQPNPPTPIGRAPEGKPARLLVENVGATLVFIAGTEQAAQNPEGTSSGTYQLRPGISQVFVLAPSQVLFAIGAGAGSIVSVSGSDAIPIGFERGPDGTKIPTLTPKSGTGSSNPAWRKATGG